MSPVDPASRAGITPEVSSDSGPGTFSKKMTIDSAIRQLYILTFVLAGASIFSLGCFAFAGWTYWRYYDVFSSPVALASHERIGFIGFYRSVTFILLPLACFMFACFSLSLWHLTKTIKTELAKAAFSMCQQGDNLKK